MCRSTSTISRRCPCDTSEARRQRYKAAKLLKEHSGSVPVKSITLEGRTLENSSIIPPEQFREYAANLREEMYATPPKGYTQEEWDMRNEELVTQLGVSMGAEVDRLHPEEPFEFRLEEVIAKKTSNLLALQENNDVLHDKMEKILTANNMKLDGMNPVDVFKILQLRGKLTEEETQILKEVSDIRENTQAIKDDLDFLVSEEKLVDWQYRQRGNQMAQEYQRIIAEIRPVGGKLKTDSSTEISALLERTVNKNYPTEWINGSNDYSNERILVTDEDVLRPYYTDLEMNSFELSNGKRSEKQVAMIRVNMPQEAKDALLAHYPGAQLTSFTLSKQGENQEVLLLSLHKEEAYTGIQGVPPEGEGWEQATTINTLQQAVKHFEDPHRNQETEVFVFNDILCEKSWTRPAPSKNMPQPKIGVLSPTYLRSVQDTMGETSVAEAIVYHEFGHRMERTVKDNMLARQQKAFLARRTNKSTEQLFDNMKEINFNEFAHEPVTPFVNVYMGREYFTNESYEVFTTGIESLYSNSYGGLIGNSSKHSRKDLDHRGFTLGALAVI